MNMGERALLALVPFVYLVLLGTGLCVWLAVGPLHALSRVALFVCMVPALLQLVAAGSALGGTRAALLGRVAAVTGGAPLVLLVWALSREPGGSASADPGALWGFAAAFVALHGALCAGLALAARAGARARAKPDAA